MSKGTILVLTIHLKKKTIRIHLYIIDPNNVIASSCKQEQGVHKSTQYPIKQSQPVELSAATISFLTLVEVRQHMFQDMCDMFCQLLVTALVLM